MFIVIFAINLASLFFEAPDSLSSLVADLGFMKPGSRRQEAEADFIGLMMMAKACYDPREAVGL